MQVNFLDWIFKADVNSTATLYSSIERDIEEMWCSYDSCSHYLKYKDSVFPHPVLDILIKLGINYNKEVNIIDQGNVSSDRIWYETWFDFKGEVLSGPIGWDKSVEISDDFSMCVVYVEENALSHYFGKEKPVVSLHFIVKVPL